MLRPILCLWLVLVVPNVALGGLPRPAELEPAVEFWTRVYTDVSTNQGYLHDAQNLQVVYEKLDFPKGSSHRQRERIVRDTKERYERALRRLAQGKKSGLGSVGKRILDAWPEGTSAARFRQAANNLRFQLGQSDRFRAGLIRSGQWKPHIQEVLERHGLPEELDVLPHVESSFNPDAYSKVAAAGMWQFMPSTARQFMRVDHIIDERMDPYEATEAAARLLKRNHDITGTWPLALTAYNHGANGMLRAARVTGTRDIGTIIEEYSGPAFGFASRNFYPSFLAALKVDRNAEQYFGALSLNSPLDYDTVKLPDYVPARALAEEAGVTLAQLRTYNPALRDTVWSGEKHIPRGYVIRFPRRDLNSSLKQAVASLAPSELFAHQQPDVIHRVARGESLSTIAQRYNTSVSRLKTLNGIRNAHHIRAGAELKLPSTVPATRSSSRVANSSGVYVIQSGDSLWSISRRFNVSQSQLVAWNGISNKNHIKPGRKLKIAPQSGRGSRTYVIQPGDSLWAIARRFDVSLQQLAAWNDLENRHHLQPGQVLQLAAGNDI